MHIQKNMVTNKKTKKKVIKPFKELTNLEKAKSIGDSLIKALKIHRKERGFK